MSNFLKMLDFAGLGSQISVSKHSKAGSIGLWLFQLNTGHLVGTAGLQIGGISTTACGTFSKS